MKKIIAALFIVSVGGLLSCAKQHVSKSEYPFVYLNSCFNKTFSNDKVELCLTNVADSRCPQNVDCIWAGTASANFQFTVNKEQHDLTLSIMPHTSPYAKDTIVDGYKVELINVFPYPVYNHPPRPSDVKAEVAITKL